MFLLYVCIVVLDRQMVIYVGYICVWWLWTGTWSDVLAMCLCVRCLCLVPAALWLYMKSGAWCTPDARGEWPL